MAFAKFVRARPIKFFLFCFIFSVVATMVAYRFQSYLFDRGCLKPPGAPSITGITSGHYQNDKLEVEPLVLLTVTC